jgi:2-polyprenyl-3-methyl-5-hydroxy-6-metoxy-1,4-benzoquinol methylase
VDPTDDLLQSQIQYYRARSGEYDDWFFRRGRYDRGAEHTAAWFREVAAVSEAVDGWIPRGRVLELAAGTGLWTERLAARATSVTAVDASPEALRLNRSRLEAGANSGRVTHVVADLFSWSPEALYDGVFFGFWLSHVPPERFDAFWHSLGEVLEPEASIFFVDSRYDPTSTARDHRLEGEDATTVLRRLDDGRAFRIVKVFHRPLPLTARLSELGWSIDIRETDRYFLYGRGSPKP